MLDFFFFCISLHLQISKCISTGYFVQVLQPPTFCLIQTKIISFFFSFLKSTCAHAQYVGFEVAFVVFAWTASVQLEKFKIASNHKFFTALLITLYVWEGTNQHSIKTVPVIANFRFLSTRFNYRTLVGTKCVQTSFGIRVTSTGANKTL